MMSTLQSYIYEDLHPKIETQNTPESHLLIVHIPDGFAKEDIGAKVEYDFGRVRVFGERSIGANKMKRFNEKYQVPSHCDVGNIRGKYDGNGKTVTIIMPNIPGKVPPQEQKPIEESKEDQKDQQNTSHQDSKSNVESKDDATPQDAQKLTTPQKDPEETSQKDQVTKDDENPTVQEATKESIAQKGQDEISQKEFASQKGREEISNTESESVTQKESLSQKSQEEISQKESIDEKGREEISQKESIDEKGREEIFQKSEVTEVESKEKSHHETPTPSEETHKYMPEKSQDQGTPDKAADTKDAKLQTQKTTSSLKDENKENQKFVNEESKNHLKKPMESEKPQVMNDSPPTLEKETKYGSKETAKVKAYIEKGKEMMNDKFGDDNADEKKSGKKSFPESTRTRIKDMALSTTQAVTNYAKRFNEEDKQKLIYTGATILVVALGVYASYKYRSSPRT
ncbi:protein RESTRICTED TEV MOVEMENT 2-like [Vicia villosa]|uniref:protein RESTRICTED TEV MOVEMENT 2-like n=1 Tax=Vicia villosa TaxID=3911 RepID=UPI00273CB4A5|nr:protein RESTRICTED TEV MOVEMENT 2-like [Vicia villosa]